MENLIKPYHEESKESFIKRMAYYYRMIVPRIKHGDKGYEEKKEKTKPISPKQRKEIIDFWSAFISPAIQTKLIDYRFYDVYHYIKRDTESLCRFIPDTFYYTFIDDYYTNPQHSIPCDDKNLYDLFFHDINRAKVLFRMMHDMLLDEDYNQITVDDAIAIAREHGEVILKESRFSGSGLGVIFWNSATDDESIIKDMMRHSNGLVCQALIKQHSELSRLNPTSVNTVRIMTMDFHGDVHVLSSVLRMGINGARVDNASSGGVVCGIRPDGHLKEVAYDTAANVYLKHPQGTVFKSVKIPNFDECVQLATSLARRCCSLSRLISWDFAIGEDGSPILIEFNVSCGELDFHQLCNGPVFGDMTEDVLKDVFNNSYTLKSIIASLQ